MAAVRNVVPANRWPPPPVTMSRPCHPPHQWCAALGCLRKPAAGLRAATPLRTSLRHAATSPAAARGKIISRTGSTALLQGGRCRGPLRRLNALSPAATGAATGPSLAALAAAGQPALHIGSVICGMLLALAVQAAARWMVKSLWRLDVRGAAAAAVAWCQALQQRLPKLLADRSEPRGKDKRTEACEFRRRKVWMLLINRAVFTCPRAACWRRGFRLPVGPKSFQGGAVSHKHVS